MRKPHGRGLELARKHVASCLNELSLMLKSREFLKSQSNITLQDDENCTTASGCRPVGFDVSLNSRLLSPTPPRAVKLLSWSNVSMDHALIYALILALIVLSLVFYILAELLLDMLLQLPM
jgi:hypothetical protein